jgi:beta-glucosidase
VKGIDVVEGPELNLARVPQSGRIFESYGEDPTLTSDLGAAEIEGIQSQRVMALAKHFGAYSQETARSRLNQLVPRRALAELYDAPFEAAVTQAHVAGVMCAIGSLNGLHQCADPFLYSILRQWHFDGFVRSDLRAALDVRGSFAAGLDLIRPASSQYLARLITHHQLSLADLNRAVRTVLSEMFAYGLISHPRPLDPTASTTSPLHSRIAMRAAEEGIVLLKNTGSLLPLSSQLKSIAVIGADSSILPESSGAGSSKVNPPFVVSPLSGIEASFSRAKVLYSLGTPVQLATHPLGKTFTIGIAFTPRHLHRRNRNFVPADLDIESASNVTNQIVTASKPGTGRGWSYWSARLRPDESGIYEFSIHQIGDTWLYLNGRTIMASRGLHAPAMVSNTVSLRAHQKYFLSARWFSVVKSRQPSLGVVDATPLIDAAVKAARAARVAIVFASDFSSEGTDHTSLTLPGDEDALIQAVAAANPRTVVVLNTGGPVLMPWLRSVAAVLEAWYPGEEDGAAVAAVLSGRVDPSGRLPITFPSDARQLPDASLVSFPGVDALVDYGSSSSALDIGYRWYQVHHVTPLFPFGYGLDYTTFRLSKETSQIVGPSIVVTCAVTNVGEATGTDVVQVYVKDPTGSGEPPEQLRGFTRVTLTRGATRTVNIHVPLSSLQVYKNGGFETLAGSYQISVGQSSADLTLHNTLSLL